MHICKEYALGYGHIEARDDGFLVSFYGPRVRQQWVHSLQAARFVVRALAVRAQAAE